MSKSKKSFKIALLLSVIGSLILFSVVSPPPLILAESRAVERFGLLVDQFAPNSNNPGMYGCNAIEFRDSLLAIGWQKSDFQYLFGENEITIANLQEKMDYLETEADRNDVVVIFFATHGYGCLRDMLNFNTWFHSEFLEIQTDYKVLLIDACHAGEFISPLKFYNETDSFYAMGSVSGEEFAIGFVPGDDDVDWQYSEPLFYGIISAHFWSQTLTNQSADSNDNSIISLQEMYDFSFPLIRKIYSEVFEFDAELAEFIMNNTGYTENYPNPEVVGNLPQDFSLYNQYFADSIPKLTFFTQGERLAIILGSIGGVVVITAAVLSIVFIQKQKRLKKV